MTLERDSMPTGDVWIDVDLVEEVLLNVIENALVHTPPGSPVEVRADDVAHGSSPGFLLEVVDHGEGIAEDAREEVTREFTRGDRSPTGGTGLGLAIACALTEADRGSLSIGATPGGGATVAIWYPQDAPPARHATAVAARTGDDR